MLLLNINRQAYMGSQISISHSTSSDLEGQSQGHSDFEAFYLVKEQLSHMLLLNINRKAFMGSPVMRFQLTLSDLERLMSRSLRS